LKSYFSIQYLLQWLIKEKLGKSVRLDDVKNYLEELKNFYDEEFYHNIIWARKIRNKAVHDTTLDKETLSNYANIMIHLNTIISKYIK
ncbi:MAG: hypothetical protein QXP32_08705, partial [Nitrososphaeria archaeon]